MKQLAVLITLLLAYPVYAERMSVAERIAADRRAESQNAQEAQRQYMLSNPDAYLSKIPGAGQREALGWMFGRMSTFPQVMRMNSLDGARDALASVRWPQDQASLRLYPHLGEPKLPYYLIQDTASGFVAKRNDLKVGVEQSGDEVVYTVMSPPMANSPLMRAELLKAWLPGSHDVYYQETIGSASLATKRITPACQGSTTEDGVRVICGKPTGAWGNTAIPALPDEYVDRPLDALPAVMLQPGFPTGAAMSQAGYLGKALAGYDLYAADDKMTTSQKLQILRIWQTESEGVRITAFTGIFHDPYQVDAWVKGFKSPGCRVTYANDPTQDPQAAEGKDAVAKEFPAVTNYYWMMASGAKHPGFTLMVKCEQVKEPPKTKAPPKKAKKR